MSVEKIYGFSSVTFTSTTSRLTRKASLIATHLTECVSTRNKRSIRSTHCDCITSAFSTRNLDQGEHVLLVASSRYKRISEIEVSDECSIVKLG